MSPAAKRRQNAAPGVSPGLSIPPPTSREAATEAVRVAGSVIPQVLRVVGHAVAVKQLHKLVMEAHLAVVFLLIFDISAYLRNHRLAD